MGREGESCTATLTLLNRERKREGERENERGRELYYCMTLLNRLSYANILFISTTSLFYS